MKNFRLLSLVLSLLTVATFLSGCCTDPVNGSTYFCLLNFSQEDEIALGKQYAPTFSAENGGVYPDADLHAHLNDIVVNKMAKKSHRAHLPWEFTILNTSQINAFAIPGGKVFVTRGLLARLENEAQFAQLMGHEIGHVSHRHSVQGQNRGLLFGVLVAAVGAGSELIFDPDEPNVLETVTVGGTALATQLAFLKFSRDQELESDERGVDYALQAGYDPREATKTFAMFRAMKDSSGQSESLITGLLSTHPLDSDRIDNLGDYIGKAHPNLPPRLIVTTPKWDSNLARLQRAQPVYDRYDKAMAMVTSVNESKDLSSLDEAESILRDCVKKLPGHAAFHVGLGIVGMERDDLNAAERDFGEAVKIDPDHFVARFYSGIVHMRKERPDEALTDLERAHRLHPLHPLPCFFLGTVFKDKGEVDKAREWFSATIDRSAKGSDVRREARTELDALGEGVTS